MKKILFLLMMILFSSQTFAAKYIALTFDDGPNPKTTPQFLKILKDNGVHGTFFMLGKNANANPDLVKAVLADGNEIGNHSYSHPQLNKLPLDQALKELSSTNTILKDITGQTPTFRRPPYGSWTPAIQNKIDMKLTLWNIDTHDRKFNNADHTLAVVKANAGDGRIILMHDVNKSSVIALPKVIAYLKSQGYTFVTISQLAKISPQSFKTKGYTLATVDMPADSSDSVVRFQTILAYMK